MTSHYHKPSSFQEQIHHCHPPSGRTSWSPSTVSSNLPKQGGTQWGGTIEMTWFHHPLLFCWGGLNFRDFLLGESRMTPKNHPSPESESSVWFNRDSSRNHRPHQTPASRLAWSIGLLPRNYPKIYSERDTLSCRLDQKIFNFCVIPGREGIACAKANGIEE